MFTLLTANHYPLVNGNPHSCEQAPGNWAFIVLVIKYILSNWAFIVLVIIKIYFWPSAKNKWVLTLILIDSDSGHIKLIFGMGLDVWFRYLWRLWKRNFWLYLKGGCVVRWALARQPRYIYIWYWLIYWIIILNIF